MNIGIIITPFIESEKDKEELFNINLLSKKEQNCFNNIPSKYINIEKNKKEVSSDIMIINYLQCIYKDINIKILNPLTLKLSDLQKNDLNFILTFDILEAFHNFPKKLFLRYKNIIERSNNIYPNIEIQKFINYKSIYYDYLKKNNINVQDFFIIHNDKNYIINLKNFFKYKKLNNWKDYVIKPIYGQESIDIQFIKEYTNIYQIQNQIEFYFLKKYPAILFQKKINENKLDNSSKKEYRTYFIGEKYIYMISEFWDKKKYKDNYKSNIENTYKIKPNKEIINIINFAEKIVNIIPKIIINDIYLKHILLRIDITYDNYDKLVISEIEFVPSLFIYLYNDPKLKNISLQQLLGDEIYNTTKNYTNQIKVKKILNNNDIIIILLIIIILIYLKIFII